MSTPRNMRLYSIKQSKYFYFLEIISLIHSFCQQMFSRQFLYILYFTFFLCVVRMHLLLICGDKIIKISGFRLLRNLNILLFLLFLLRLSVDKLLVNILFQMVEGWFLFRFLFLPKFCLRLKLPLIFQLINSVCHLNYSIFVKFLLLKFRLFKFLCTSFI